MRHVRLAVVAAMVFAAVHGGAVSAQWCGRTFAYGNAGFASGYSMSVQRFGWCGPGFGGWCRPRVGGWCGPVASGPWCGPRWGARAWCAPPPVVMPGWSFGWPAWYGTTWVPACGSVWIGSPFGGSFFSGGLVPYPAVGGIGFVPGFASTTVPRAHAAMVAANAPTPIRPSNASARLRAARLVAVGDRHLHAAGGDASNLRRALDAYRRAAVVAADQPDIFIRQAIVLAALGRGPDVDAALDRVAAIDGRLAEDDGPRAAGPPDPIFGDRAVGEPSPLAARGQAVLRQIADAEPGPSPVIARLAGLWSDRFAAQAAAMAAR